MKIQLVEHRPEWKQSFETIKGQLMNAIGFVHPIIEHIGSTSIAGLSAKPIIDILIGVETEDDLEKTLAPLVEQGYIYYEVYNEAMPYRRFFVKHRTTAEDLNLPSTIGREKDVPKNTREHSQRLAHIHILRYQSEHWIRHIAFREYLRSHPSIQKEYQLLKEKLSAQEWEDGNEYNQAKDRVIKTVELQAIEWFKRN